MLVGRSNVIFVGVKNMVLVELRNVTFYGWRFIVYVLTECSINRNLEWVVLRTDEISCGRR